MNFPFICSTIPAASAYGVYISQLIRYSRECGYYQDFLDRGLLLTRKLLKQQAIIYTFWQGMSAIALSLSPRYQLLSAATQRTTVGTEGTINMLLPDYQVYKCLLFGTTVQFKILNCRPFSGGFLVYFISAFYD